MSWRTEIRNHRLLVFGAYHAWAARVARSLSTECTVEWLESFEELEKRRPPDEAACLLVSCDATPLERLLMLASRVANESRTCLVWTDRSRNLGKIGVLSEVGGDIVLDDMARLPAVIRLIKRHFRRFPRTATSDEWTRIWNTIPWADS